jgi:hypothetical protein
LIFVKFGAVADDGCAGLTGLRAISGVAGLKLGSELRQMAEGSEAFVWYNSDRLTTDFFEAEKRKVADNENRMKVTILTGTYRVKGFIEIVPGARVTDYLVEAKNFIAVTDAEVRDLNDRHIMNTPFLNINRECIQIVAPQE